MLHTRDGGTVVASKSFSARMEEPVNTVLIIIALLDSGLSPLELPRIQAVTA